MTSMRELYRREFGVERTPEERDRLAAAAKVLADAGYHVHVPCFTPYHHVHCWHQLGRTQMTLHPLWAKLMRCCNCGATAETSGMPFDHGPFVEACDDGTWRAADPPDMKACEHA